jgi:hypothetical protein
LDGTTWKPSSFASVVDAVRCAVDAAAPVANPPSYGLRVSTLDRRAERRPTRQGWCRSALPWSMDLTGVERFERQP